MPKKNSSGEIVFSDYPEFRPNLTPGEIFQMGSFGTIGIWQRRGLQA